MTGGIFNFAANLAGIVTPLVVGFIVAAKGSFVGALSYIFIVGDIKRFAPKGRVPLFYVCFLFL